MKSFLTFKFIYKKKIYREKKKKTQNTIIQIVLNQNQNQKGKKNKMHTFSENSSSVPAFLAKLWRLVEDEETNNLIYWSTVSGKIQWQIMIMNQQFKSDQQFFGTTKSVLSLQMVFVYVRARARACVCFCFQATILRFSYGNLPKKTKKQNQEIIEAD